jgi:hypothetical protein
MLYFKHQTNMRHDLKIKKLINRYGLEGYGLYNLILESITESICDDAPLPQLQESFADIAEFYRGDTKKIFEMAAYMVELKLLEFEACSEIETRVTCHKIYKFLEKSSTRSGRIRNLIDNYKKSVQFVPDSPGHAGTFLIETESESETESEKKQNKEIAASTKPPAPKKQSKESHPDYVRTVELFATTYERLHKAKMSFSSKDGKQIKDLLSNHSYDEIKKKIDIMISRRDTDAWLKQQALTPGLILSQWNKLIAAPAGRQLESFDEYHDKHMR